MKWKPINWLSPFQLTCLTLEVAEGLCRSAVVWPKYCWPFSWIRSLIVSRFLITHEKWQKVCCPKASRIPEGSSIFFSSRIGPNSAQTCVADSEFVLSCSSIISCGSRFNFSFSRWSGTGAQVRVQQFSVTCNFALAWTWWHLTMARPIIFKISFRTSPMIDTAMFLWYDPWGEVTVSDIGVSIWFVLLVSRPENPLNVNCFAENLSRRRWLCTTRWTDWKP